jgi:hypothetical protein
MDLPALRSPFENVAGPAVMLDMDDRQVLGAGARKESGNLLDYRLALEGRRGRHEHSLLYVDDEQRAPHSLPSPALSSRPE